MKIKNNCVNIPSVLFLIITCITYEFYGQPNVEGEWSGSVTMKQEYTGELGRSVLEITTTFMANVGTGTMQYEAQWNAPFNNHNTCSGSGNAELYEVSMSESDNPSYYEYYIHVMGPEYTCSPPDQEGGQNKRDVSVSDKVLATNKNILSGTQTLTGETGTGPVTTILTWHLTRTAVGDVELIVTPEKYDTWLPEPGMNELTEGSVMNISLKLQARGGGSTTKKAKVFELQLSNTSIEPGITINYPIVLLDTILPDLRFLIQANASMKDEKFQSMEIKCPGGCQTGTAKIGSYDGGGWTVLNVEAILEDDNTRIKGMLLVSGGEMDIRIPKRDPNSKIGEVWLKKYNSPGEMDDIETSKGNTNNGDGLTAYEEYRGVISEGKFKRLEPGKKEIGIQAEQRDFTLFAEGINWFKSASNLEVVRFDFDRNEIAGNGRLNVNAKSAHDYDQYALYLLNGGLGGGTLGIVYSKTNSPDIPAQIISVVADWTEIQATYQWRVTSARPDLLKFTLKDYLAQTVAHELGHAVDIWHHGDTRTYNDWTVNDLSNSNRIFDRNGNPITTRPITLSNIGYNKGTVESGNILCMLNYYPYFNWGYTVGADGANIFNEEPLLPLGKIFCDSKNATGINATELYFGDAAATKGNCFGQIKLR